MAVEQEIVSKIADHGARLGSLETWKKHHEEQEHPEIDTKLWNLQSRLPTWAVFLISGLMGLCGWFAGSALGG